MTQLETILKYGEFRYYETSSHLDENDRAKATLDAILDHKNRGAKLIGNRSMLKCDLTKDEWNALIRYAKYQCK